MSINVTVKGNPVKIHRGRMITNGDPHSKEFDKRRKMRLQQVRQQSKDIAESVRNKVKGEKSKQQSSFEKQGATKLKQWQNRKLMELQDQYQECLQDIGLGHTQAQMEEDEEELLNAQESMNRARAQERGRIAQENLQVEKNEKSLKQAIPQQHKRFSREVENVRAAMVAKAPKRTTPKKSTTKPVDNFIEQHVTRVTPDKSNKRRVPSLSPPKKQPLPRQASPCKDLSLSKATTRHGITNSEDQIDKFTVSSDDGRPKSPQRPAKVPKNLSQESMVSLLSVEVPPDTRISDRIRNRQLRPAHSPKMSEIPEVPSREGSVQEEQSETALKRTERKEPRLLREFHTCHCHTSSNPCYQQEATTNTCSQPCSLAATATELPSHPTVCIRNDNDFAKSSQTSKEFTRVKYYDHKNKYTGTCLTDIGNVRRICPEDVEYVHSGREDDQLHHHHGGHSERDRMMANTRGRVAMERHKARKEYETLMKQLPALQRQERIANLNPEKDKMHMSEKRRQDYEKSRQERIESAFEKLVPKRITIPTKRQSSSPTPKSPKQRSPIKVVPNKPSPRKRVTSKSDDKDKENATSQDLKNLLRKLKSQKEELLRESKTLPENSNFYNLIDELDFVTKSKKGKKPVCSKQKCDTRYEAMKPKKVLVLQNTSTQTSPKTTANIGNQVNQSIDNQQEHDVVDVMQQQQQHQKVQNAEKKITICDCKDAREKCQILIKINEDESPKIIVTKSTEDLLTVDSKSQKQSPRKESTKISKPKRSEKSPKKQQTNVQQPLIRSPQKRKVDTQDSSNWKDTFASSTKRQNQRNDSVTTTSTSYYSPPHYPQVSKAEPKPRKTRQFDARLIKSIKRLLEMPKGVLDDLGGLSTVSEVSTPSSSIINTQTNRPAPQTVADCSKLKKILQMLNLTYEDLVSTTSSSSVGNDESNGRMRYDQQGTALSDFTNYATTQTTNGEGDSEMAEQFAKWADIYQERINNLAAMIDQVRMEKQQMLLSPNTLTSSGASDNITSYMKLPHTSKSPESSAAESPEQVALTKQLLSVNLDNVDAGKPAEPKEPREIVDIREQSGVNKDVVERYLKLIDAELKKRSLEASPQPNKQENTIEVVPESPKTIEHAQMETSEFTPMLDIPKLPKFSVPFASSTTTTTTARKPPVSANALRFNEVVHELSIIPEAESSRLSKSPLKGTQSPRNTSIENNQSKESKKNSFEKSSTSSSLRKPSKYPSPIPKVDDEKSSTTTKSSQPIEVRTTVHRYGDTSSSGSSNSSSTPVDLEGMLKQIGLDWAISALKKSANGSGSGRKSLAASTTTPSCNTTGPNDESKVNVLIAQSLSSGSENLSSASVKRHQRTSTPIQTTNSSKRSNKLISSGESDISPVQAAHGSTKLRAETTAFDTLPCECDDGASTN